MKDKVSIDRVSGLHPKVREDFTNFISDCKCYSLQNLHGPLGVTILFSYKDCNGAETEGSVDPGDTIKVCAIENSISQTTDESKDHTVEKVLQVYKDKNK